MFHRLQEEIRESADLRSVHQPDRRGAGWDRVGGLKTHQTDQQVTMTTATNNKLKLNTQPTK